MSSGERLKVDAEWSSTRVGEDDPGASDISCGNVVFGRLTTSESFVQGTRFLFLFGVTSGISDLFLPIGDVLLPWLYTSPVSLFLCLLNFCK